MQVAPSLCRLDGVVHEPAHALSVLSTDIDLVWAEVSIATVYSHSTAKVQPWYSHSTALVIRWLYCLPHRWSTSRCSGAIS